MRAYKTPLTPALSRNARELLRQPHLEIPMTSELALFYGVANGTDLFICSIREYRCPKTDLP